MFRTILTAAAVAAIAVSFATPSKAQSWPLEQYEEAPLAVDQNEGQIQLVEQGRGEDRLLIVNGNTRRVIYDDGYNDLFCVTRRYVAYYNYYGRPVFRRVMRCR